MQCIKKEIIWRVLLILFIRYATHYILSVAECGHISVFEWFIAYRYVIFFFSSRRRHTRFDCDWSSDMCSSDLAPRAVRGEQRVQHPVPGGEWPDVEATEELPHHGQGQEDLGQRISVRRAGRRLGVVLGDLQHALVR